MFKKTSHILRKSSAPGSEAARDKWLVQKNKSYFEKKFCSRQRSCPGQVACSTKIRFFRKSSAPGSEAAPDKWLVQKQVGFLGKSSAPDKWFGREKANNRCGQGRGASFGGSGGRSPPGKAGGCGGAQPPRPQIRAKIIVKLPINRPGGRYVVMDPGSTILDFGYPGSWIQLDPRSWIQDP